MKEQAKHIVREEVVLEKFEGDPADGKLLERITLVNGEITKREVFDEETPKEVNN
jgi:hypothetical protein